MNEETMHSPKDDLNMRNKAKQQLDIMPKICLPDTIAPNPHDEDFLEIGPNNIGRQT